ncbi:Ribokinase [Richelia intracellularis HH01]|uniref:Ribokinase n=1 Tax=Richelia intracellularis HH01 TaxID=1165094 RepID=M1WTF5_9NOST|nr:sugar kinase [Richelia intracellularis]CCH68069.1 Ribokinase [Richelia intracellularis HH01]HAE05625.1 sugar kinase [Richelia sp.]
MYKGLFVGLVTLDLIYLSESSLQNNKKITATNYIAVAGGPSTNAGVTFSHLGNIATVTGAIGSHPITQLIKSDLNDVKVKIFDLKPINDNPPPISSIIVSQETGERAVISINALGIEASSNYLPKNILNDVSLVLIDGHQMEVSQKIAIEAKNQNITVVIDGGSWKSGFEKILPYVDYAICSSDFFPPNCHMEKDIFNYLRSFNIPHIAITHGEQPITYSADEIINYISVPKVITVDTLGAGDIFHGAFCHYLLISGFNFPEALTAAANIASSSCSSFGTRNWMKI